MEENVYFDFQKNSKAPKSIKFLANAEQNKLNRLRTNQSDFTMTSSGFSTSEREEIKKDNGISLEVPHIGFTYWISLNSKKSSLKNKALRIKLQNILSNIDIDFEEINPFWTKANQLYLPDGGGRLTYEEVRMIWQKNARNLEEAQVPKTLKLLVSSYFPFKKNILKSLESKGIKIQMTEYKNQLEFESLFKSGDFDLFQTNNDFSSFDLLQNLIVTFQKSRPLIILEENSPCYSFLEEALKTTVLTERFELYKKIEREVLVGGYIAPIAYNHIAFLFKRKIDISDWSTLFPDISFWKSGINN